MTIFGVKSVPAVSIVLLAVVAWLPAAAHAADECDQTPAVAMADCLDQAISAEKAVLDQLYSAALAKASDNDTQDIRKSKVQLVKAQTAWGAYVQENCAYVGGIEGGANLWVSIFAQQCVRSEYAARIAFFRHPPSQD
jgi:uncharacterized protein YecT (DUF1311 family)